jgi:hypothetical protein
MAIGFASPLVTRDVFEEFPTFVALEALRMPALFHGVDNSTDDGLLAVRAEDCTFRMDLSGKG